MDIISNIAQGFIGLFTAGGETFTGWVTGIIPQVVCLLTFMNSIIKLVGEERVEKICAQVNEVCNYSLYFIPFAGRYVLRKPNAIFIWTFC